mmetsp:Transcript_32481/g.83504  ORF Transcript_32481/g.83504 Transcript_32481/m.83504 type:complete len:159 (-) Transcript_32481:17-493(-)
MLQYGDLHPPLHPYGQSSSPPPSPAGTELGFPDADEEASAPETFFDVALGEELAGPLFFAPSFEELTAPSLFANNFEELADPALFAPSFKDLAAWVFFAPPLQRALNSCSKLCFSSSEFGAGEFVEHCIDFLRTVDIPQCTTKQLCWMRKPWCWARKL